jgi:hypothetical protein
MQDSREGVTIMRWEDMRRSDYVEERSGGSPIGFGGMKLGGGAIILVIVVSLLLGKNPLEMRPRGVYARLVRTARQMVQDRAELRRYSTVQHLCVARHASCGRPQSAVGSLRDRRYIPGIGLLSLNRK